MRLLSIDWMRSDTALLAKIQDRARLSTPTPNALVQAIQTYCTKYKVICEKWGNPLHELLDIDPRFDKGS